MLSAPMLSAKTAITLGVTADVYRFTAFNFDFPDIPFTALF